MRDKAKNIASVIIAAILVITTISASSFASVSAAMGNEKLEKISYSCEIK